jgi:PAS domain S-box-containing protein
MTARNASSRLIIPQTFEIFALGVAALCVLLLTSFAYCDLVALGSLGDQFEASQRAVRATTSLLSALKDAESGQRGFLLTGRESYLDTYSRAVSEAPQILISLTSLTAKRPDQVTRLETVKPLVREKLDELQKTIELYRLQRTDAALVMVLSDRGKILMDQIRYICAEIETAAHNRLVQQTKDMRSGAHRTLIISFLVTLFMFGLLVSATLTFQRGTQRKQKLIETLRDSEQELRNNQQMLQAIIENSTTVIYVKELTGRYALVNRNYAKLFHVTQAEMAERTDYDVLRKEQADAVRRIDEQVAISGKAVEVEETVPVEDGLRTYLSIRFPICDATDRVYAVGGISTDITERKRAEAVRAFLARIVESSDDAIVSKTLDGIVMSWNMGAEKMFGYSESEMVGQPINLLIPPGTHDEEPEILARVRRGETLNHYETTRMRKDGTTIDVSLAVSPLTDGQGKIIGASKIARDITERKRASERLRAQVERLSLLDQITAAMGERLDLRSIFQVVVRSLEDSLGIDFGCVCVYNPSAGSFPVTCLGLRSEILGTQLSMTGEDTVGIDQDEFARYVGGALIYEPDIRQVDFPFLRRLSDAGLRSVVIAPLMFESRVFGIIVTARQQADSFSSSDCEFLRQLSAHVALAAHQAEMYSALQLAYDDLRQTQQAVMQHERLRALGQMASGIAHDINNALSPVALYTQSLLEREPNLSTRTREYLETTERALDDVAHTVARMQEFYRQREPQLTLMPVDLNLMVQQVLELTRVRWNDMPQQRGIVIHARTELAPDLPIIAGIESEIRETLVNLIFNAVDAMPDGGTLTLRTRPPGDKSPSAVLPYVHVQITDTGQGMDEETRRRCLEPFFTTKGERGTGLGLAMVFGMIQRHNAEIQIESAPGAGTTILLSFPAVGVQAAESTPANEDVMPPRLRILVVDDDPQVLKSLREVLEGDGHIVTTATGGQEGIDAFQEAQGSAQFAIVITDLGMPRVDGRRVAAAVKGTRPSTGVILLTGWGQRLVTEGDVPAHVDRVLTKPPNLRELRAALAGFSAEVH